MADEHSLSQIREAAHDSQRALIDLLTRVDDKAFYQKHGDEDWTMAVMLSHLAESRNYFIGQAQTLLKTPGSSVGRPPDHIERMAAIDSAKQNKPMRDTITANLVSSHEAVIKFLDGLRDEDLNITGQHVTFGVEPLRNMMWRSLVQHTQVHIEQAKSFLAETA